MKSYKVTVWAPWFRGNDQETYQVSAESREEAVRKAWAISMEGDEDAEIDGIPEDGESQVEEV